MTPCSVFPEHESTLQNLENGRSCSAVSRRPGETCPKAGGATASSTSVLRHHFTFCRGPLAAAAETRSRRTPFPPEGALEG